ncbi:trypsin-like serine peptidase [Dokdonella sp. MW10]|uniref:trypsin-like serine peptidase n=1 Tax=Dokdonella sp. MW10 TaxID=2992926 RepID=UPI003F7DE4B1
MDLRFAIPLLALALCALPVHARQGERPPSLAGAAKSIAVPARIMLPAIDAAVLRGEADAKATRDGMPDKRLAIALGHDVMIDARVDGAWQVLDDGTRLWRVDVQVPGATDLHLGFARYALPPGAALWVTGSGGHYEGPYTADDGAPLWVPMVPGDLASVELRVPASEGGAPDLVLTHVDAGFRDLFKVAKANPTGSGACNINVACPLGDPYPDEKRALAYYEFRGSDGLGYICTGTLLNTVPGNRRNLVLTAAHCMSTAAEVASMRVYWNYRSTQCSPTTGWSLAQNQTGATLRATRADADFTLVELTQAPDPAWNVYYAGWDAGGVAPSSSIGLHHPRGDVAKVTRSANPPRTTNNCINTGGTSANTHWLAGPYAQGTTEGGSSGSGLWIPAGDGSGRGKRLIGMLSGGTATCSMSAPTQPDTGIDCYGKLSAAWDGTSPAVRLRDWLDPAGTNTRTVAGLAATVPVTLPAGLVPRTTAQRQAASARASGAPRVSPPRPFDPRTRP